MPAVTSNFLVPRESIMSILLSTRILSRVSGLCNVEDLAVLLMDLFYDLARSKQVNRVRIRTNTIFVTTFRISAIKG